MPDTIDTDNRKVAMPLKQKPKRLLFFYRVAFICNVFFLACLIIRYTNADAIIPQPLIKLAAILGWIFSPVINMVCILISFIAVLKDKGLYISLWLIILNVFFFGCEIFYFFIV